MRWLAAVVGLLHRILLQGEAFLYPAKQSKGYWEGRLLVAREAVPIVVLFEDAGGNATNGTNLNLDLILRILH